MTEISLAQKKLAEGLELYEKDQFLEAIECFSKAIELNPKYDMAYHAKGLALQDIRKYSESIECFKKASELRAEKREPSQEQNNQEAADTQTAQVTNSGGNGKPRSCCNMF